ILCKEGFRVGVAKHVHQRGFTIDVKGKDSWRFAKAGAKTIAIVSPNELAVIKKGDFCQTLENILNLFNRQDFDIVFLEGFHTFVAKRRDIYKIITAKNREELDSILKDVVGPILAVTGRVVEDLAPSNLNVPEASVINLNLDRDGQTLLSLIKEKLKIKGESSF
ncbi:MAG: molybdopterin-guanine dinucleotide biosynthesis protein MobB, partial [Nitrososphaerota archaeon]|nr:molybdopterin-guanine dinucleotide biosynthesis protein MobB [Nitrososphaerales archaeon]MDW8044864.1 molybdopterin-guanine dinucleotide biosynthesis protein MobB [Nitrososphaerota archaeon]